MEFLKKYNWGKLNTQQLGSYSEYFAKMEFTMYGFDVYTTEVDYQGIDFIVKTAGKYYDIQVKSVLKSRYIYMPKRKFKLRKNLLLVVLLYEENQVPNIYLIPSLAWESPNSLFVSRTYEGKKSEEEWGMSLSQKNQLLLDEYQFDKTINLL